MTSDLGAQKFEYAASFTAGASRSTAVHVNGAAVVGLYVYSGWNDALDIGFEVSQDGVDWFEVIDAEGALVTVLASAGKYTALPAGAFHGIEWVRLVSLSGTAPAAQANPGDVTVTFRPFQ